MDNTNNELDIQVLLNSNLLQAKGLAKFTYITSNSAKQYLIYTLNEKTEANGKELTKIYVSETNEAQGYEFSSINQEEWGEIKNIMSTLGQIDARVPNNVQLSALQPTQYTVGPYRKIAINDSIKNNLFINQMKNEPKDTVIIPKGNTTFFDPSLKEDTPANQEVVDEPAIPDAFSMAASVPSGMSITPDNQVNEVQETAPIQEQPMEVPQPVEVPAEVPAVPTPVAATTPVELANAPENVIASLNVVSNYLGMDANTLINKLNEKTDNEVAQQVEIPTEVPAPVEVQPVQETAVQESTPENIDINNLPVVPLEPTVEENVLNEEPISEVAPATAPVAVQTDAVVASPVESEQSPIVQQVVSAPTDTPAVTPVTPIVEPTAVVEPVQPIVTQEPVSPVVETPVEGTSLVSDMVSPIEPVNTVVEPVVTPVEPAPVIDTNVITQVVQDTVPVATTVVPEINNVEPVQAPVESTPVVDQSVISQVIQPVEPVVQPAPVETPISTVAPVDNTSIINQVVQPIEPVPEMVTTPVIDQPIQPVELVNTIVQPVESEQPQVVQPEVQQVNQVEIPQVIQPVQFVESTEPVAQEAPVPTDVVQTQVVDAVQTMPTMPSQSETIQTEEVNITVPTEPTPPVESKINDMGVPPITPLSQEDKRMVNPVAMGAVPEDTSFLDAGPVVVPQGQENVASMGLPGDSGVKTLERAA